MRESAGAGAYEDGVYIEFAMHIPGRLAVEGIDRKGAKTVGWD